MAGITSDTVRTYDLGSLGTYPVAANAVIYSGAVTGLVKTSGYARQLQAGDEFAGIAMARADNTGGSAGDISVTVRKRGRIQLSIPGCVATDPVGTPVYASDDNTFTFNPAGGSFIGKLSKFVSSGVGIVAFNTDLYSDPHAGWLPETHSAGFTLDIQDSGKLIVIDTDGVVVTLPATAAGGKVRFLNIGAYGAVGFALSPNALDKIQGPDIAGADNKDLILTKATARRGDMAELIFGQADGPYVSMLKGIWATEA